MTDSRQPPSTPRTGTPVVHRSGKWFCYPRILSVINVYMSYRPLPLSCICGEIPDRILEVGFTSDRHMVVHYWCSSCSRVLFISRSLEECTQACPPAVAKIGAPSAED